MRKNTKLIPTILILFIASLLFSCGKSYTVMMADVLKIGKADTAIFRYNGHCMIIDCGEKDDGNEILEFLDNAGIETVDLLILTHFDKDHIGGASKVLKNKKVEKILMPDYEGNGEDYQKLLDTMAKNNLSAERVTSDTNLVFGDITVQVMPSGVSFSDLSGIADEPDNDMSLVTLVTYGNNRLLFTGDLEAIGIRSWLDREDVGPVNLIKMPHHGQYNDETDNLIASLSPKNAVICCSDKNPPDKETLDVLNAKSVTIWETRNGDVHIKCDGKRILISQ